MPGQGDALHYFCSVRPRILAAGPIGFLETHSSKRGAMIKQAEAE